MKAGFAALFFVIFLWSCEKSTGIGPALVDPTLNTLLVERYVTGRASTDIFSINEDGMNAFRLTTVGDETKTFPRSPFWGPDDKIYFTRMQTGNNPNNQIYSVERNGSNLKPVTRNLDNKHYYFFSVSRKGQRFLYSRGEGLRTSKLDGSDEKIVTSENFLHATWHPDGQRVVYVGISVTSSGQTAWNLFIANFDGSDTRQITFTENNTYGGTYVSPDGTKICYTNKDKVYIANLDGTAENILSYTNLPVGTTAGWSSDGQWLYFITHQSYKLYMLKTDGLAYKQIGNDSDTFLSISVK